MATEISQSIKITRIAGADLSAAAYRWVKLNASGQVILCTAITDRPVGILQNAPRLTEEAEICVAGGSKVVGGAALAIDALIGTDANSAAKALTPGTDTTAYVLGRVIGSTGAANELASVLIDCAAPTRAT
jgi:hypothetical protein